MGNNFNVILTNHANDRSRQRGIRCEVIDMLYEYGRATSCGDSCDKLYMDHKARFRVRQAIGDKAYAQIERQLDAYLVLTSTGEVRTCGHRLRRIRH